MHFVYVKFPLGTRKTADERVESLHAAIDLLLSERRLGDLISWGASVTPTGEDGAPAATHHRMDMEVADLGQALPALRDTLAELHTPDGTEVHFTQDGIALQLLYAGGRWSDAAPTTATTWRH